MMIDRRKAHPKAQYHPGSAAWTEAAGSGGNRSQKAYKAPLEQKIISPRFGCLHIVGQAGPMVARESRHMLTYAKTKSKAGSKVDGLWKETSGHAVKP